MKLSAKYYYFDGIFTEKWQNMRKICENLQKNVQRPPVLLLALEYQYQTLLVHLRGRVIIILENPVNLEKIITLMRLQKSVRFCFETGLWLQSQSAGRGIAELEIMMMDYADYYGILWKITVRNAYTLHVSKPSLFYENKVTYPQEKGEFNTIYDGTYIF